MVARLLAAPAVVVIGLLAAGSGAAAAVSAPRVEAALRDAGYPVRKQCGVTTVPPLRLRVHGFSGKSVPTCWAVIEQDGYSVHATPYATAALARLVYARGRNPWARTTRTAAIGNVLLRAYRLPTAEWSRISAVVAAAVAKRP